MVAQKPDTRIAYIVLMKDVLKDIADQFGQQDVKIPTKNELHRGEVGTLQSVLITTAQGATCKQLKHLSTERLMLMLLLLNMVDKRLRKLLLGVRAVASSSGTYRRKGLMSMRLLLEMVDEQLCKLLLIVFLNILFGLVQGIRGIFQVIKS